MFQASDFLKSEMHEVEQIFVEWKNSKSMYLFHYVFIPYTYIS